MKNSHLDLFGKSSPIQFKRTGNTACKFSWGIPVKRNKVLQSERNNERPSIFFFLEVIFKNCFSTFSSLSAVCFLSGVSDRPVNASSCRGSLWVRPRTHSLKRAPRSFLPSPRPHAERREEWKLCPASAQPHHPHLPDFTPVAETPARFAHIPVR